MITTDDIKAIFNSDMDVANTSIQSFIDGAYVFVNNVFIDVVVATDLKEEITKYVAAHLLAATIERFAQKEGAGGAEITYIGTFGVGLNSTPYGQMAIAMDTTGRLAAVGKKVAKTFAVKTPDYSKE